MLKIVPITLALANAFVTALRQRSDKSPAAIEGALSRRAAMTAAAANEKALASYIEDYEYDDGESRPHTPSEWERDLINDSIRGLLADDDFLRTWAAWQSEEFAVRPARKKRAARCYNSEAPSL